MKVSIVIRAYNEEEHIGRLLLGISQQSVQPHEVILVDSGSTDNTVEIAQRFNIKIATIAKDEFTFGGALNLGCRSATGDIFVFASAHVYPIYDNWLAALTAPFEDPRVSLTYGRQSGNSINKFSEHQIFAKWFPAKSVCPQETYFCNNANCAIRASTWQSTPYDETLTGLEDLAWAKAIQAGGHWISYVAEAEIKHVHAENWQQIQNRYFREALAMRHIDHHAKFSKFDLLTLLPRNIVSDIAAALKKGVLFEELGSIVLFRYHQLTGTYKGFNSPPEILAQLRERLYYPHNRRHDMHLPREHGATMIDYDRLEKPAPTPSPANTAQTDQKTKIVNLKR